MSGLTVRPQDSFTNEFGSLDMSNSVESTGTLLLKTQNDETSTCVLSALRQMMVWDWGFAVRICWHHVERQLTIAKLLMICRVCCRQFGIFTFAKDVSSSPIRKTLVYSFRLYSTCFESESAIATVLHRTTLLSLIHSMCHWDSSSTHWHNQKSNSLASTGNR
jgi:hypothetical protein